MNFEEHWKEVKKAFGDAEPPASIKVTAETFFHIGRVEAVMNCVKVATHSEVVLLGLTYLLEQRKAMDAGSKTLEDELETSEAIARG